MSSLQRNQRGGFRVQLDGKDIIKAILGDYSSLVGQDTLDQITDVYKKTGLEDAVDLAGKAKGIGNTALDTALGGLQDYLDPKTTLDGLLKDLIPKDLTGTKKDDTLSEIFGLLRTGAKTR